MASYQLLSSSQGHQARDKGTYEKKSIFNIGDGTSNIRGMHKVKKDLDVYSRDHDLVSKETVLKNVNKYNTYYKNNQYNTVDIPNKNRASEPLSRALHGNWDPEDLESIQKANGRVQGVGQHYIPSFKQNQVDEREIYNNFSEDSIKGNFEKTDLSRYFFSLQNVMQIQRMIKYEVYRLSKFDSNFIIDNQSDKEIKTVMRSYFLQTKMSMSKDVLTQINELNEKVKNWCADEIFSNLMQYRQYTIDISENVIPMERPTYVANKGEYQFGFSNRNNMKGK